MMGKAIAEEKDDAWVRPGRSSPDEEGCTYSRIRRKSCTTVEDPETKKPVFKCEKVEQLLKNCPGRRPEVVESKTEQTEEEVPEEDPDHQRNGSSGLFDSESPLSAFSEALEDHLSAGMDGFLQAAEDLANEIFGQFGFYKQDRPDHRQEHQRPNTHQQHRSHRKKTEDDDEGSSNYDDYRGFSEV